MTKEQAIKDVQSAFNVGTGVDSVIVFAGPSAEEQRTRLDRDVEEGRLTFYTLRQQAQSS